MPSKHGSEEAMRNGKNTKEKEPVPKDDRLIFLVFTAQLKLKTYLKNTLARAGVTVTPAQSGILFLLKGKNGQTMSELSQVLSLDNSTLTGLVDRLERAGFVKRNSSESDRRASHVFITDKGYEETNRAKAVLRQVNEQIKADFTGDELEAFKKILKSFFVRFGAQ
jgi:DNA-binding MarR family transcriptional regulator